MIKNQQIPAGYKQTDVGVIPEDWEVKRLDELFYISAGRDLVKNEFSKIKDENHKFPVYSNALENRGLYGYTKLARHKKNCLTITARGTIGVSNKRFSDFDAIGRLLILDPKVKIDGSFISEYINNNVSFSIESTGVPQLTAPQASTYLLAFPNPTEQTAIAEVLSDIDSLITKLSQLIQKKRHIKQGAMQELLTGKRRLPGFSGEWEMVKLGDLFQVTRGQVLSTKEVVEEKIGKYKYPVFSSQTLDNGLLGFYNEYLFENAITWTTDGANAGKVVYRSGKFYCTNVCGVLINSSGYANHCVAEAFNLVSRKYVSYVGNPKLMNNVVKEIELLLPKSVEEQQAISDILLDLSSEIEALEKQKTKYIDLKQGMMQQLLTGKIRLV